MLYHLAEPISAAVIVCTVCKSASGFVAVQLARERAIRITRSYIVSALRCARGANCDQHANVFEHKSCITFDIPTYFESQANYHALR
jgi:hypothetical protein